MMFFMHNSHALQFLALLAAVSLFVWSLRNQGTGVMLAKIVSGVVAVLVLIGMVCSLYFSVKYWKDGYLEGPMHMQMKMMGMPQMAGKPGMAGQNRPGMPPRVNPGMAPGSKPFPGTPSAKAPAQ